MGRRIITEQVVLNEDGEIIDKSSKTTKIPYHQIQHFMMIFYEDAMKTSSSDMRVLFYLNQFAKFNDPIVDVSPAMRQELMELAGLTSSQSLSNVFKKLKADRWITELFKGRYMINPNLSWKGELSARDRYIKEHKELIFKHFTR